MTQRTDLDSKNLPDSTISIQEMNDYGYTWEGMLPLRDRMAFYWTNFFQIYLLYPNDTEAAANDFFELHRHANDGGIFGIDVENWEKKEEMLSDERSKEKSLIEIVMEYLGVVEGEKFNILLNGVERSMSNPFMFKDQRLEDKDGLQTSDYLSHLVTGVYKLEKLPENKRPKSVLYRSTKEYSQTEPLLWIPNHGDAVWVILDDGTVMIDSFFECSPHSVALYKCGWLFRTKELAEKNLGKVLKEMKDILLSAPGYGQVPEKENRYYPKEFLEQTFRETENDINS